MTARRKRNGHVARADFVVPPHSVDAEQATLGCLLTDASCWSMRGSLSEQDFYRPDHHLIFTAIAELAASGVSPDVLTVSDHLQKGGHLDEAGGMAYIGKLARDTLTSANFEAYAAIVHEKAAQRRFLDLGKLFGKAIAEGATSAQIAAALRSTLDRFDNANAGEHGYELVPVSQLLRETSASEWLVEDLFGRDHIGLVGPPESGKSAIALHVAACVATGQPFFGRPVPPGLVVYLLGEGQRGVRLRLEANENRYGFGIDSAPFVIARAPTSFLDAAEVARVHAAIRKAERQYERPLTLLIVDTVSRFIAPGNEDKAQDMGAYLVGVERLRGTAAAISIHHPGHGDATRARGSSSWRAGLDSEFTVTISAGNIVTLTCQKMKDGSRPNPLSFRVETSATRSARKDGSAIQSIVIVPVEGEAAAPLRSRPTGKNQKQLLAELERLAGAATNATVWTEGELREIARELGMHKNSARDAVLGIRQLGYLTATVGGSRLSHGAGGEGPKDRNRTESTFSSQAKGPKTGDEAQASLEAVPSVLSDVPDRGCAQ